MLLHIGYRNFVDTSKILSITTTKSAPIVRTIKRERENGTLIDCTMGKGALSAIFIEDKIILSAFTTDTLVERMKNLESERN